jgi:UrcA family protein
MMTLTKATLALALLASAGGAVAQPQADDTAPVIVVSYRDLDIGSPAGLHTLQMRVQSAASRLCVHQEGRQPLALQMAERRCMSAAMSSAQVGIDQAIAQHSAQMAIRAENELAGR